MRSKMTEGTDKDNNVKEPHSRQQQHTMNMSEETQTHTGRGKREQTPEATSCLCTHTLKKWQSE